MRSLMRRMQNCRLKDSKNETYVPALQSAPCKNPWFPYAHEDTRRKSRHQCTQGKRSQTTRGLRSSFGAESRTPNWDSFFVRHLLTRAHFQAVLRSPPVANTEHFALHRVDLTLISEAIGQSGLTKTSNHVRSSEGFVGAMLPKKWAKRAVTRNAIRRQVYRVSEQLNQNAPAFVHVVRMKKGLDPKTFFSASSVALKSAIYQELFDLMRVTKTE